MRNRMMCQLLAVIVCACIAGASWSAHRVIYVDGAATGANDGSSWADAYVYLQDALTEAGPVAKPLEIRVAQGVYTPPDRRTPFELFNGVTLKGGYAGVVGVDSNSRDLACYATTLSTDSWGHEIITGSQTDPTAVIDGFIIKATGQGSGVSIASGSPTFIDCRFVGGGSTGQRAVHALNCNSILTGCRFEGHPGDERHLGDGIRCEGGHLTLRDCVFVGNRNDAIWMAGTLDLIRCSFLDNLSEAVSCHGKLVVRDSTFVGNGGSNGVVSCSGNSTFVNCGFTNNALSGSSRGVLVLSGDRATLTRCLFAGNSNSEWGSGAISSSYVWALKLSHCLFIGNSGGPMGPGALSHFGAILRVSNCTFAHNRGRPNSIVHAPSHSIAELSQCIVWDGPDPFARELSVTYSNVQGGYEGQGNIEVDPGFVAPGYWDTNGTPDDPNDDVWVMGDYHLKSQAGHWDQDSESWIGDEVTSPCIDAGDPNGPLGVEPFPNGGYVNLGAYGGTSEASRSYFGAPVCETQIAGDINGDCKVDDLDMDILMSHWLMPDIGKANVSPTIKIISPEDGAELTYPTPIICCVDASDPDGTILQVSYVLKYDDGDNSSWAGRYTWDATDSWRRTFD